MIGASRRRSALGRSQHAPAFELHVREARSATIHRRLLHLAVAALVAAVAALLLPLSTPVRAAVVAGAALAGALIPTRNPVAATLKSIRDQTGLSYETAIEVSEGMADAGVSDDPYGFKSAVVERAALTVRGYESPPRPAWWLPAMIVAVALVLLPELLPGSAGGGFRSTPTAPREGGVTGPAGPDQPLEPAPPEPPAPGQAEAPFAPQRPDDESGDNPVTDLPDGDMGGQAPLSRFLQSLRERPATGDGAPTEGPASQTDDSDSQRSDTDPERQPGDGADRRFGDPSNDPTSGSEPDDSTMPSSADAGQQQSDQQAQDEANGEDGSAPGTGDDEGQVGLQPGTDQPDEGAGEGGRGEDSGTQGLQAGGNEEGAGTDGADSAGEGGAEASSGSMDREAAGGPPDLLFGVLQDGPENVAGSVRLPGSGEVELPAGRSFSAYQSAAEEALTESDLPLDYQEIIRRYFQ